MAREPGGSAGKQRNPYKNPFRGDTVTPERIDQGVDYAASPGQPIYALGPGTVDMVYPSGSGWPGGGWVSYVLSDGPAAGERVFVAEDVTPNVREGQHVTADTIIGHFNQSGSIETGFAGPFRFGDQTDAAYLNEWDTAGGDPGRYSTEAGVEFSNLLATTGAPPGILTPGGIRGPGQKIVKVPVTEVSPSQGQPGASSGGGGLAGFFESVWLGLQGGLAVGSRAGEPVAGAITGDVSGVSDVAQGLAALTLPFVTFARALDWFFVPSHWIRIFAGIGGAVVTTIGIVELSKSGKGKQSALPLGIGLTGLGAVLLFVAFHNLDPSVKTPGDLLAHLQAKAQASAKP